MPEPMRIQRRRTKGWRLPPNSVCVTRPHRWSNPWKIGDSMFDHSLGRFRKCETVEDCVQAFRRCIDWDPDAKSILPTEDGCLEIMGGYGPHHRNRKTARIELAGKNLACFCRLCDEHKSGKPLRIICKKCERRAL